MTVMEVLMADLTFIMVESEMDAIADLLMDGENDNDGFGNSVSTAGDINNDGFSDVIVGAPFNDDGGT